MKALDAFLNEKMSVPRFWVKKNYGQFAVVDREDNDKMVVGYSKKIDAETTANGLLATDEKDLEEVIKKLKSKEGYGMFTNEEAIYEGKTRAEINAAIIKEKDNVKNMEDKMKAEQDLDKKRILEKKIKIAMLKIELLQLEEPVSIKF